MDSAPLQPHTVVVRLEQALNPDLVLDLARRALALTLGIGICSGVEESLRER